MVYAAWQGIRSAVKDRRYVLSILLLLTVGGGGAMALAAFLRAFVFAPFDFRADQILIAHGQFAEGATTGLSAGMATALEGSGAFSHVALVAHGRPQLQGEEPRQLSAAHVANGFFEIFQVPSTAGNVSRLHTHPSGVVISYDFWRKLGSNTHIVGQTLRLDDGVVEVVAVAPRGFNVPAGTELWRPLTVDSRAAAERGPGPYDVYLSSDTPISKARAAAALIAAPDAHGSRFVVRLERLTDDISLGFSGPVRLLVWAVAILIASTLTNVYLLVVARGRRVAACNSIHASLGATPALLFVRGLAEVVLVVSLGCLGALLLSSWLFRWLWIAAPAYLTEVRSEPVHFNVVLYAAVMFTVCCSVALLTLVPSAISTRTSGQNVRGLDSGRQGLRMQVILAIQLAIATAVIGITITLVKTYLRENVTPSHVRPDGVITFELWPSPIKYRTAADRSLLFTNVVASLTHHGTVANAALTSHLPFGPLSPPTSLTSPEDRSVTAAAVVLDVTRGFFDALGISVQPTLDQLGSAQDGAVITSSLKRVLFQGQEAVGRSLRIGRERTARVVAVAEDVDLGFRQKGSGFVFAVVPAQTFRSSTAKVVVRVDVAQAVNATALVKERVRQVDPQQPLTRLQALASSIELLQRAPRFRMMVFMFAAVLVIVVSTVGVASMQGYYLTQRRPEFALRAALGASPQVLLKHGLGAIVPSIFVGSLLGTTFALYSTGALLRFDAPRMAVFGDSLIGTGLVIAVAVCASAPALITVLRIAPRELLCTE